jgi:hypothetical protein
LLAGIRSRLTYANVMATIAVFIALGGGAYAAFSLPRNSVKSKHIVNHQVKAKDLVKPAAVKSAGLPTNESGSCAESPGEWAEFDPDSRGRLGYYRDVDGVVHLNGAAVDCSTDDIIFHLPPGFRPRNPFEAAIGLRNNGPPVSVDIVRATGEVNVITAADGDIYKLDPVSFRCGPSGEDGCP